ncbi:hypothetical protein SEA_OCTOBIEN14_136 [Gordonia phage Octobien14]|uniref:Uncharacterized protein n=1 Tax=Gordonia phage Octobien14 TaxID=2483673 RepID=A0A3G3M9Y6_9CAUD|nr:hypothetical protein L3Y22_gp108 [Gordonia phage Octobien14]AYR03271.1 hypothetical protein SEA_OCTOBIEN14_136 [Gordonia phage Octobien14]
MNVNYFRKLASIVAAVEGNHGVTWSEDDGETSDRGTLRRINYQSEDVLSGVVEITSRTGVERSIPLTTAVALAEAGMFYTRAK